MRKSVHLVGHSHILFWTQPVPATSCPFVVLQAVDGISLTMQKELGLRFSSADGKMC